MTLPVIGYLDPEFFGVMDDVCEMLREFYSTSNELTLPMSCTGTGAMEAACVNILERGDTAVICRNGFFGHRLADIAERCGAETFVVDSPWGEPVNVQSLSDELKKHSKVKAVGIIHGETSTGVLTPLPDICNLAHEYEALLIVDAVTSLGSHEIKMDEWDIDISYSATQKSLGAPPGLAPICLGHRAMDAIRTRTSKIQSFYLSLKELENYWSQVPRAYHHTAPTSMIYALREALRMAMEEGLGNRIERHARVAAALWAGLEAMGLKLLVSPNLRLNPVTSVLVPDGIDDAMVRRRLLDEYNIEISGGLGELRGKIWRVGLMGESCRETNVFALLSALEMILPKQGYAVGTGASLAAAQKALADFNNSK
jgi:alanine-glyoxylate transaminase/serine-glyoxylate transaminase/serine-pyruvate transaminase